MLIDNILGASITSPSFSQVPHNGATPLSTRAGIRAKQISVIPPNNSGKLN